MNSIERDEQERKLKRDIKKMIDRTMARYPRYIIGYSDCTHGITVYVLDTSNAMHAGYSEIVYDRDIYYEGIAAVTRTINELMGKYNAETCRIC